MDDISIAEWPAPGAGEDPPRVAITTLGGFRLRVDGQPLAYSRKVPRKPLSVLKAVVALGHPAICQHRLVDALWPDAEADAAHQAFHMALHRLRKLLGARGAVVLHDGRVRLEPRLCWVDAWAFEGLAGPSEAGPFDDDPACRLRQALALYRGDFLADEDAPWVIAPRARLRDRFLRLVVRLAGRLEALGRWDESLRFYRQALEVDPHVEAFCQGVMRAALHLGRKAEGITVFRCYEGMRPALARVTPSADTEQLLRSLLG